MGKFFRAPSYLARSFALYQFRAQSLFTTEHRDDDEILLKFLCSIPDPAPTADVQPARCKCRSKGGPVPLSWFDFANRKLLRPIHGWFIRPSLSQEYIYNRWSFFQVPENTWTNDAEFAPAQLSSQQLGDYLDVVQYALNATEHGVPCTSETSPYTLPESLRDFVAVRQIGDLCVLAESTLYGGTRFDKGLPILVLRSRLTSSRPVHISAAHTQADGRVHLQSAAVFEQTGARSLLASTRHRAAYAKQGCSKLSDGSPVVPGWVTDAAHHDVSFFSIS